MDLFSFNPHKPDPYPAQPGYKDRDTSRQAAEHVASRAELLRDRCAQRVRQAGAAGLTADEAADALGESVLSIRPRFTELLHLSRIKDSGQRRKNGSGRSAKVWVAA